MEGLGFLDSSFNAAIDTDVHAVLKRCFKNAYRWGIDGTLHFAFSDGIAESFHSGKHQMAISSGIWFSAPGLLAGTSLYVCSSAMEAVAFALSQEAKLADLDQSCWIALGLRCQLALAVPEPFKGRNLNLLFGRDLLDVLRAVKICVSLKGFSVHFWLREDRLECQFRGLSYSFPVAGFSLSRFKQATGFRDYSSMKRPLGADSFMDRLRSAR